MDKFIFGFWGAYFGAIVLMLTGAAFAFAHGLRQIARNAALAALASALFVMAFLGALPIDNVDNLHRCMAALTIGIAALLFYLLLSILGLLRRPQLPRRIKMILLVLSAMVIAAGAAQTPLRALTLSLTVGGMLGLLAFAFSFRHALRGDRQAWGVVAGVFFMLLALAGLSLIALDPAQESWQLNIGSAVAGTLFIANMTSVLWMRYYYLIELREVMAHGPSHDPVTRMRSHSETGQMVGNAFKSYQDNPVPLGMMVVSINNLLVLRKLYGQAAVNHALFVCAGRLRRTVPAYVEMGRIADDGFLLLARNCVDSPVLLELARAVQVCLSRSVVLHTSLDAMTNARHQTRWAADVGVGVQRVWRVDARAAKTVAMARGMSRTAWSFPSRVVWYDDDRGEIVGVPLAAS